MPRVNLEGSSRAEESTCHSMVKFEMHVQVLHMSQSCRMFVMARSNSKQGESIRRPLLCSVGGQKKRFTDHMKSILKNATFHLKGWGHLHRTDPSVPMGCHILTLNTIMLQL